MFCMVALGVGEMTGGLAIGQLIDKRGSRVAVLAILASIAVMTVVTLVFLYVNTYNWLAFATAFIWGFQDSCVNTHSYQMLGFEFDD